MILVNTDYITGKELEMLGLVKGSTIQSKNVGWDITQSLKTLVGGELKSYTDMINQARALSTERMVQEAESLGADAVINIPVKFRIGKYYYNGTTWTETESKFNLPVDVKKGDSVLGRYFKVRDTNDFTLGIGDISGFIVKAPDFNVIGDCEVTFYYFTTGQTNIIANEYSYMKNLVFAYGIPDEQSIYGDWVDKDSKNDLVYENVIDEAYIEEAGEIDLRICTNPDGKLALSSVIQGNDFLTTLVTDAYGTDQPEKLLLKRVVDLFETPRFTIDPTLANDAKPYTVFIEPHLGKTFMVAGGEEDVKMESCTYNLIEI